MSNDLGRSETVTFLRGDDEAKLRELRTAADRLEEGSPERAKAAEAHDVFAKTADRRGTKVTMRSVGRKTWRRLLNEHPPREGNEDDQRLGANVEEFGEAAVKACLASPTFSNDEDRDAFLDTLSEAQFGRLEISAFALNTSIGADPKARLGSAPATT